MKQVGLAALVGVAGVLFAASGAAAQRGQGGPGGGGLPPLLGEDAPKVGDVLPDVEVYDASGARIRMHDLPGKHRVIVFGCLT